MRRLISTLLLSCSLALSFSADADEPEISARLLVSNPSPYLGEEIDLILEIAYSGHPGGRTRFSWPNLDNFVAADLTVVRSNRGRDKKNRLVETITRRIKPLLSGTMLLAKATVLTGKQRIELPPLTLRVQPLPTSGKPENFNHYIGNYQLSLAAAGTGPREISLHIYDSNRLAAVPKITAEPGSGAELIPIDTITRAAGAKGREHILRYFYSPAVGEQGVLRFSLPAFDPQLQTYIEAETGPIEKPTPVLLIVSILFGAVLFAGGLTLYLRQRHPRTIEGCLQRLCQRPVTGLSREKIHELLQPYFNQDEFAALHRYWQNIDSFSFHQIRIDAKPNSRLVAENLRKSLCKAIDKQQNIT